MNNYLAAARAHADDAAQCSFGSATQATHLALAQTCATLAIATTLPQGTEDAAGATPCTVGSAPSPAEPSLVALDAAEAVVTTARQLKALWREDAFTQSSAWWNAVDALLRSVEAIDTEAAHHVPDAAPTEPSLVTLDRADEIMSELRRWREADRIFPVEANEWWDATLRLRDMIDRLDVTR